VSNWETVWHQRDIYYYQIRELNKGMETGNAHVRELQDEVNKYKQKHFDLQNKQNDAKQKIQQLEWDM